MLELLRTFFGYCLNCRRPTVVGEFKVIGWQHVFNLCDSCLQKQLEKLQKAGDAVAMKAVADQPLQKEIQSLTEEQR